MADAAAERAGEYVHRSHRSQRIPQLSDPVLLRADCIPMCFSVARSQSLGCPADEMWFTPRKKCDTFVTIPIPDRCNEPCGLFERGITRVASPLSLDLEVGFRISWRCAWVNVSGCRARLDAG